MSVIIQNKEISNKLYLVFMCPKCGYVRYAKEGQKSAKCFKCEKRTIIDPARVRIVFRTDKIEEAIATVQRIRFYTSDVHKV